MCEKYSGTWAGNRRLVEIHGTVVQVRKHIIFDDTRKRKDKKLLRNGFGLVSSNLFFNMEMTLVNAQFTSFASLMSSGYNDEEL